MKTLIRRAAPVLFLLLLGTAVRGDEIPLFKAENFRTLPVAELAEHWKYERDIPYRDSTSDAYIAEKCRLDVYYPDNLRGAPVLINFHGGGLTGGDKGDGMELYKLLGCVTVNPNYRLSPKVKAPAYIEDAAAVLAWTKKNISLYGGDPERIYVTGHSAGGYLVACLALMPQYLGQVGLKPEDFRGFIPVSGEMVTHFTIRNERGLNDRSIVVDEFAPIHYAKKDTPPFILISGATGVDWGSRAADNKLMADAMRAAGNAKCIHYEVPGADHGSVMDAAYGYLLKFIRQDLKGDWKPEK